jgi:hypothetical protein
VTSERRNVFDPVAFGRNIRVLLAELNIQQRDAARQMGVDKCVLNRICKHGNPPSVENYLRIVAWMNGRQNHDIPLPHLRPAPPGAAAPRSAVGEVGAEMTLGSHQSTIGKSQVHLTPKWIIDRLGPFDLDPCAATVRPWDCARVNFTEQMNGLAMGWLGFVWLNPPFDRREVGRWISKLADHGNGIALLHARTETGWFEPIWQRADLILFMADRIHFCRPDGTMQEANSGAPAVLVAFGQEAVKRLRRSGIAGAYVSGWSMAA